MRVKAKHWLNYNGSWHRGGDTFEVPTTDVELLSNMVEIAETPVQTDEQEETEAETPKRRGRQKKSDTVED